ncbi:hypothetical protein [Shimazuella alba]|uniref:Uncharacterized protein n=1 Tax=Shimazuella alba TaxID=2690964 RepID=A0A6I4W0M3_9BACL|nr:hypothetical protein [Shimazuella alba]MXQ53832.1 hypothetical protein [Shimazuella alba]
MAYNLTDADAKKVEDFLSRAEEMAEEAYKLSKNGYAPDYHLVQMYTSTSESYSQLAEKYAKVKEL